VIGSKLEMSWCLPVLVNSRRRRRLALVSMLSHFCRARIAATPRLVIFGFAALPE